MWKTWVAVVCVCAATSLAEQAPKDAKPITCTGRVTDAANQPIAGAVVEAYALTFPPRSPAFGLKRLAAIRTNKDGAFALRFDAGARMRGFVVARARGLAMDWINWTSRKKLVKATMKLLKPTVLAGTVVDENGAPVAGAQIDAMLAVGEVLRNSVDRFAGRALPGPIDHEQIPALAERGRRRIAYFMDLLDERLGESEHVAGPNFSVADITALVAVDFAARVEDGILDSRANVKRWHEAVSARPSAQA